MLNLTNRRILQFFKYLKETHYDFLESVYSEFEEYEKQKGDLK